MLPARTCRGYNCYVSDLVYNVSEVVSLAFVTAQRFWACTWMIYPKLSSLVTSFYVDDTNIYFSFASKDFDLCLCLVAEDLKNVSEWCCANNLSTNPVKTKFVPFGVRQPISKLPNNLTVPFLGQDLVPVTSAKDLGFRLDSNLTFNGHIATLTSSLLSTLVQINRVRHFFCG